MSLFGLVTDAEQVGWQRRAVTLLDGFLAIASYEKLPPLRWTVGDTGTLVGHGSTRSGWQAWQGLLQLRDVQPEIAHHGVARLRSSGRVATSNGWSVQVVLIADIDLETERLEARQDDDPPQDAA